MNLNFNISKQTIFYFAWILMEINICIANSNATRFATPIISYLAMSLFLFKIFVTKKYKIKEILAMTILVVGSLFCLRASADMRVVWLALALCAAKETDFDKTVRYSLRTMVGCCLTFMLMYATGIIEGAQYDSLRGVRFSFGLGHPNMCSAYYSLIMMHIIYLYFDKLKIKHLMLFTTGAVGIYYLTRSNTGVIVSILSLIIVAIVKYLPLKKFNAKIISLGLIGGIFFFTCLPIIYDASWNVLDTLMTGRLHQANFYYQKYGVTFWGNNVSYDLNKWNTDNILDMGYAKLLINNGIFYYSLVVAGYIISIRKATLEKRRDLLSIMGAMVIYLFTENVATFIFMNVSMLVFSQIIFSGPLFASVSKKEIILYEQKRFES